jgi:hypothetical protein
MSLMTVKNRRITPFDLRPWVFSTTRPSLSRSAWITRAIIDLEEREETHLAELVRILVERIDHLESGVQRILDGEALSLEK